MIVSLDERLSSILIAIRAELSEADVPKVVHCVSSYSDGSICKLQLRDSDSLGSNLEGWSAWWPSGIATVLSTDPEQSIVNLEFLRDQPPSRGEIVHLYQPKFLESLRELWKRELLATEALRQLDKIKESEHVPYKSPISPKDGRLRKAQRTAFSLTAFRHGFLWGPPGTGKTFTLGNMLAEHMSQRPSLRILLLSNTNSAVDQAILSVDDAVNKMSLHETGNLPQPGDYIRMGVSFQAQSFVDRDHLLPLTDPGLLDELRELERDRPPSNNAVAYSCWRKKRKELTKCIPRGFGKVRLLAMTTTEATQKFDELQELGRFDLLVFDEASQVGKAQALMLMNLSDSTIFAGDPNQLSPIVQNRDSKETKQWLGTSMFDFMQSDLPTTCMLNEQGRMAKPISDLVSSVFYQHRLTVAADCNTALWAQRRTPPYVSGHGEKHVMLRDVGVDAEYSKRYGGLIRYESAAYIAMIVSKMLDCLDMEENKIIILSPFHSQNRLLKEKVNGQRKLPIQISTVHAAQGKENFCIIFDPVSGLKGLVHGEDSARLINVAISRTQACLVMPFSQADFANKHIRQIYEHCTGEVARFEPNLHTGGIVRQEKSYKNHGIDAVPRSKMAEKYDPFAVPTLVALSSKPDFPGAYVGHVVRIPEKSTHYNWKITECDPDGAKFTVTPVHKKVPRLTYVTKYIMQSPNDNPLKSEYRSH